MSDRLLELIDAIYDAVDYDERWEHFLCLYARAVGARAAALLARFVPPDYEMRPGRFHGFSAHFAAEYTTRLYKVDPIVPGASKLPPGSFFALADFFPDPTLRAAAPIVREWLEPQGFTDLRGLVLAPGVPYSALLVALTNAAEQPFAPGMDDLARSLEPHLRRALVLQRRLVHGDSNIRLVAELLERLPGGVLCAGASGRVVLANARARATLAAGDGVAIRDGRLHVGDTRERERVFQALDGALQRDGVEGCASVARRDGRVLTVLAVPLRTLDGLGTTERATALVFLHDPSVGHIVEPAVLVTLFGLTPSQARMAALLAQGSALDEIAATLGVTLNTVRTRIKQIYERTSTSRQAELVRRMVLSAALFQKDSRQVAATEWS